ncbi:hypothetical protein HUG20_00995 [Salicibibacter cibi]|uniref:Uncharacterized protein n=1 Tax=Salicibibacter cibi TaxID=2743001 RepID=A0A7T6Z910_9BACI|nr:hypothetical protein [Salicibibacter cibi]QQK78626.1 hypothetical protein HUG20_00995 [Salicibibacter cibi]
MASLQRKTGRVSAGFARGGLTGSSAESKAMEAASRLQLITASCSAIPK